MNLLTEVEQLKNINKKNKIRDLILNYNVNVLEISSEAIELANKKFNYPLIEIGSLELFGGSRYGNL